MKKQTWVALAVLALVSLAAIFAYQKWSPRNSSLRGELLAMMPADASAVFFVDLGELRSAPFLAKLYAWAPKPQADPEYAQFIKDTGFDYERDLYRAAVALEKHGETSTFFAVADGKFDQQKISAVSLKTGAVTKNGTRDIFSIPISGSAKTLSFAFLRKDRMVLTDNPDLANILQSRKRVQDTADWNSRFERLAGSPVFAVIRHDAGAGSALAAQTPGGLRSPQLSAVLDQLQWITIAGRPENDRLRIIAEGESSTEATMRQLADLLNGVLILAEAGLNDAKTRQQLDPAARAAYLEVLRSADVAKIDRGDTKSVRLTFEITPAFLESAGRATPSKPLPGSAATARKGHS